MPNAEDLPTPGHLLLALNTAMDLLQEAQDAGALLPHDMQRTLGEVLDALYDLWARLPRQAPALWQHWPEAGQGADE
jgi:hypothetical protein